MRRAGHFSIMQIFKSKPIPSDAQLRSDFETCDVDSFQLRFSPFTGPDIRAKFIKTRPLMELAFESISMSNFTKRNLIETDGVLEI